MCYVFLLCPPPLVECSPCRSTLPYIIRQIFHLKSYYLHNPLVKTLPTCFPQSKQVFPTWISAVRCTTSAPAKLNPDTYSRGSLTEL